MEIKSFIKKNKELLELELGESESEINDALINLSLTQCEKRGISLRAMRLKSVSMGLFGIQLKFGLNADEPLPSHRFRTGDECGIKLYKKDQQNIATKNDNNENNNNDDDIIYEGVITRCNDYYLYVSIPTRYDMDVLMSYTHTNRFRIDMIVSKASHNKLMKMCNQLSSLQNESGELVQALFHETLPNINTLLQQQEEQEEQEEEHKEEEYKEDNNNKIIPFNNNLNNSQINAISYVLSNEHIPTHLTYQYPMILNHLTLIHGPPGTGKTTALVELILQALYTYNYKILVCAPSNVAVDNILTRLSNINYDLLGKRNREERERGEVREYSKPMMVRLGHPARLSHDILNYSLEYYIQKHNNKDIINNIRKDIKKLNQKIIKLKKNKKWNEIKLIRNEIKLLNKDIKIYEDEIIHDILNQSNIVLSTTVGSSSHVLYNKKNKDKKGNNIPLYEFDLVIIDEAAQAIEIECWIPMMLGKRWCLAGDHKQLPPTIKSQKASEDGLSLTLFDRLMRSYPSNLISRMLNIQYRMNSLISNWSSNTMYHNLLVPADTVANHILNDLEYVNVENDMMNSVLLLLDSTGCNMREEEEGDSRSNPDEAQVVCRHVHTLINSGLKPEEIAVITPYNGQVQVLKNLLRPIYQEQLEIRSVDGFQGGEKEAVIISLVRSNENGNVGFLSDKRRMNVAITRAKRHLALIGDAETVSNNPFLKDIIDYFIKYGDVRSVYEYYIPSTYDETKNNNDDNNNENNENNNIDLYRTEERIITMDELLENDKQFKLDILSNNNNNNNKNKNKNKNKDNINEKIIDNTEKVIENERILTLHRINQYTNNDDILKLIQEFMNDKNQFEIHLPSDLLSRQRALIHEFLHDEDEIIHVSVGEGKKRHLFLKKKYINQLNDKVKNNNDGINLNDIHINNNKEGEFNLLNDNNNNNDNNNTDINEKNKTKKKKKKKKKKKNNENIKNNIENEIINDYQNQNNLLKNLHKERLKRQDNDHQKSVKTIIKKNNKKNNNNNNKINKKKLKKIKNQEDMKLLDDIINENKKHQVNSSFSRYINNITNQPKRGNVHSNIKQKAQNKLNEMRKERTNRSNDLDEKKTKKKNTKGKRRIFKKK